MKKKIIMIIFALIIILVLVIIYKATVKKVTSVILPDKIVEVYGHKEFPGAQWGEISIICEEGGFNILDYIDKEVIIQSSLAVGKFYKTIVTPLNIHKIYLKDKIICEYYSDSIGVLIPGIFPINNPNIIGL